MELSYNLDVAQCNTDFSQWSDIYSILINQSGNQMQNMTRLRKSQADK